jgi:hypothetical protein
MLMLGGLGHLFLSVGSAVFGIWFRSSAARADSAVVYAPQMTLDISFSVRARHIHHHVDVNRQGIDLSLRVPLPGTVLFLLG